MPSSLKYLSNVAQLFPFKSSISFFCNTSTHLVGSSYVSDALAFFRRKNLVSFFPERHRGVDCSLNCPMISRNHRALQRVPTYRDPFSWNHHNRGNQSSAIWWLQKSFRDLGHVNAGMVVPAGRVQVPKRSDTQRKVVVQCPVVSEDVFTKDAVQGPFTPVCCDLPIRYHSPNVWYFYDLPAVDCRDRYTCPSCTAA